MLALLEYLGVEPDQGRRAQVQTVVQQALAAELALCAQAGNPFSLARQYVKGVDEAPRVSFFMPHHNESGYWWQGRMPGWPPWPPWPLPPPTLPAAIRLLLGFGQHQLDWILGQNPFNACMLAGHGINNPGYTAGYPNALGGICNGITAGFDDENDLAFIPEQYKDRLDQNWRWGSSGSRTPPGLPSPSLGRARREAAMIESGSDIISTGRAVDPPYIPPGLPWSSAGRAHREDSMIEYWVGVDGGGTHTRARIRDKAGKLLGEGRAAGSTWSSA